MNFLVFFLSFQIYFNEKFNVSHLVMVLPSHTDRIMAALLDLVVSLRHERFDDVSGVFV